MPFESNEGQGAERAKATCCGRHDPTGGLDLHAPKPVIDLLLCLILPVPVPRLDLALELLAISVNLSNVIVGKLAPLFLDLAGHLLPTALDAVPVHVAPFPLLGLSLLLLLGTPCARRGS